MLFPILIFLLALLWKLSTELTKCAQFSHDQSCRCQKNEVIVFIKQDGSPRCLIYYKVSPFAFFSYIWGFPFSCLIGCVIFFMCGYLHSLTGSSSLIFWLVSLKLLGYHTSNSLRVRVWLLVPYGQVWI